MLCRPPVNLAITDGHAVMADGTRIPEDAYRSYCNGVKRLEELRKAQKESAGKGNYGKRYSKGA